MVVSRPKIKKNQVISRHSAELCDNKFERKLCEIVLKALSFRIYLKWLLIEFGGPGGVVGKTN
jgi:hypothetical protein